MRRLFDGLYAANSALAGIFLVGVFVMVSASILGRAFGFHVRGTDAYAGYCMAAAGFLALAPTLRRGGHIRVEMVLKALPEGSRWALERVCGVVACAIAVFLAYFSVRLAWQSYLFNDVSQGSDATPLWIPQIGMALGCITLAVAFLDTVIAPEVSKVGEAAERLGEPAIVD